ncbi:RpoB, chloroplast (chloroplast) [Artemisia annua]|uniref:DNA-directed RNA polymerase n=1 Tax=Artemisia annua TaxID=35608 RepID=A0A2U1PB67_ARTAN|nr:RpoB, chloroplast [Artemisia annua]
MPSGETSDDCHECSPRGRVGIYRIVINQILQSPGIYYRSELNDNGISVYTGTIISDWGGRSELEIDRKARIWVRVSRQQKLSILVLLSAMGLNIREILENVCYPELFLSFLNDKKKIGSKENAILEFYQQFACVEGDPQFMRELVVGSLESPFYKISERSKGTRMLYLSRVKMNINMVAAGNSLALIRSIQEEQVVPARYRQEFLTIAWEQVNGDTLSIPLIMYHVPTYLYASKTPGSAGDKVVEDMEIRVSFIKIFWPRQDMPYLQDGRPVDMVFNPLGVPSRMNVEKIFESSLRLAGDLLEKHYRITPFDERYEQEVSRKQVFSELYEARKPYILKLIDQVDDKIHGRSSGRYSRLTQQPLKGRAKKGGQRVGEMEVWALEGFGVAYILQEMLTYKSDNIRARQEVLGTIIFGGRIPTPEDAPESYRFFVRVLRSLALELNHFLVSEKTLQLNRKEA